MKRDGNLVKIALSVSYYLKKEGHPFKNTYKKEMFQYLFLSISREPSYEEDRQWFCLALHEIFGGTLDHLVVSLQSGFSSVPTNPVTISCYKLTYRIGVCTL